MADQSIKINIGTSYNGQAMQKAMSATDKLSKVAQKTGGAIGQLGQAFGGIDGQVGKAVGSIANFAGALAMGGPVGLAIAGITSLISMFKQMSDDAEKAKKAQMQMFSANMMKGIDGYGKSLDKVIDKLGKLQTQQEKVAKSTVDLNNAMTDKSVAQRQLEAINEAEGATAGERGVIQARANVDIAKMKGASSISSADANVTQAQTRLDNTNTALGQVGKEIRSLSLRLETLSGLNRAYHDSAANSGYQDMTVIDKGLQTQKAVNKAEKKLAELRERQATLLKQQETQGNELKAAQEKAATARINAEAENAKASQALKDAEDKEYEEWEKAREEGIKAAWDEVAVRVERNAQMKEQERAEEKLKETIKAHEQHEKDLEQATKELEDAQLEYAYRLRRAKIADLNTDWRTAGGGPGGAWNGGSALPADQIIGNGINGKDRYDPRNNASIHDDGYNERKQEGYARNAQSQGYGLSARDAKELGRLELKGDDISDYDRKRRDELRAKDPEYQAEQAEREAEKARQEAERKAQEKETKEQKLRDDVAEIVTLMNKLGLK